MEISLERDMKRYAFFYVGILMLFCLTATGQTLDDAKKWYLEGRYADALPVFQEEYDINPKNAPLNQWLGICLYQTGKITEALPYLEFAAGRKIPEAYLYLGELYSKIYRFDDAEKEFEKYQRAKRRDLDALNVLEQKRQYADKLKKAVGRTENIQIIDSLVLPKNEFLSAYHLSASSGSLSSVCKFSPEMGSCDQSLYMNEREDKIYFSTGDSVTGLDIFTMDKLLDEFGNQKRLPDAINQSGNQAFPFMLSDGMTLYFASDSEPSFGGYDLFVTRYHLASDTYLAPNQLNMPFNSPFNDYMMAIDEEKGVGWFASDRFQPADSVCVYTFIPNQQVELVDSADTNYMASRARVASIADTWRKGSDYKSPRLLAKKVSVEESKPQGDFIFVINDEVTCHRLSDFKSERARSIFSQALGYEKQLQSVNKELADKREQFAASGAGNASLTASILSLEKESESLFRDIKKLKKDARNEEIRTYYNQSAPL